ncbi:MAG: cobalt ECF transporter T component CbiQ [Candidatus Omnitrophica bacterium]|nr:cobalt ECF transporter T component CbiQ [Candidatus Omnitrophota bacterium]
MRRNNFVERSLTGAISFLKDSVFADEYASAKGFLQSLDPRIKAFTFVLFVVTAILAKSAVICLILYSLCLALACLSGIHMGFFLKRTWIFIPIFSLFIAIPALFSIFTPGEAIFTMDVAGLKFIITRQGLSGAVLFVSRVVTAVSFVVLLSITTRHFALLKVLRVFGVPQIFVMTLGMCYRYIYLFLEIIQNTYLAIKSRVGTSLGYKKGQHIVAWNMSSLWQRSYYLNEEVYLAMLSRGYTGEPKLSEDLKSGARDWAWLIFSVAVSAFLLMAAGRGTV